MATRNVSFGRRKAPANAIRFVPVEKCCVTSCSNGLPRAHAAKFMRSSASPCLKPTRFRLALAWSAAACGHIPFSQRQSDEASGALRRPPNRHSRITCGLSGALSASRNPSLAVSPARDEKCGKGPPAIDASRLLIVDGPAFTPRQVALSQFRPGSLEA
jgi:hypothetical protein